MYDYKNAPNIVGTYAKQYSGHCSFIERDRSNLVYEICYAINIHLVQS